MRDYKDLFFWENTQRLIRLEEYISLMNDYQNSYTEGKPKESREIRTQLMEKAPLIREILSSAGVNPIRTYGSDAIGYETYDITMSHPYFVKLFEETPLINDSILDDTEDIYHYAVGVYKNNKKRSFINVINPLFYLRLLSQIILRGLLYILSVPQEQKNSTPWKILGVIIEVTTNIITIWIGIKALGIDVWAHQIFIDLIS